MDEVAYYQRHSTVTEPAGYRQLLADLPTDVPGLAAVVGALIVHRDETWRCGFTLPPNRREEASTRYVAAILGHLGSVTPRPAAERFAGTCRDFTVLLCALLRETGTPARARCGFAGYFTEGFFDDHWVAEVWQPDRGWRLVDAEVVSAQGQYATGVDPFDVPRDSFLVAGRAWLDCRAGLRDPARFGVKDAGLTGMWEIQGNLVRDLAGLNRIETLPWDGWGLIPTRYEQLTPADLDLLDLVASATVDGSAERAATAYASDPRLPVPHQLGG